MKLITKYCFKAYDSTQDTNGKTQWIFDTLQLMKEENKEEGWQKKGSAWLLYSAPVE